MGLTLDHHLTKEPTNSSDPKYDRLCEEEGSIQYWLLENMADSYRDRFLYFPTVKAIWEKA